MPVAAADAPQVIRRTGARPDATAPAVHCQTAVAEHTAGEAYGQNARTKPRPHI